MRVCGLLLFGLYANPDATADESLLRKEMDRRINNAREAYELLNTGDQAYKKGDYQAAASDYGRAFKLLPVGALSVELRSAAANRYATAVTEQCRGLAKSGNYDEARRLLDVVLDPSIAPAHSGALKLRQQVDDPIRYNHAITPEHVEDVVRVGRLLRQGEGYYNLGQYNRAHGAYQDVLRIDPFNKAARRGMERISSIKSDYYRAARDQSRADLLTEVDKNWELHVPAAEGVVPAALLDAPQGAAMDIRNKLSGIMVDTIDLEELSLMEALDFVRIQSRLGDAPDASGEQAGINIVLDLGESSSDRAKAINNRRVNLTARGLPLAKVLDYITDQTRTQWRTDGIGVIITPLGTEQGELVSRTFRVPPNFLQSAMVKGQPDDDDDPFGGGQQEDGKLPTRLSITDFLKQSGVSFPEGASASYTPSSNTLIVRNTPGNIDIIDQLVSLITGEEPVMVVIKTTIIRITEEELNELGFDWAITPMVLGGGVTLGGGSSGNGGSLASFNGNPLTAGNRSGNNAIGPDTIDEFINSSQTGITTDSSLRAPGIFRVAAVTNGAVIELMMRGLNQSKAADILVRPSTISRSGETSKVEVIREFIYPTEYEPPELPQQVGGGIGGATDEGGGSVEIFPVTPATPTGFETRNTGVTLEVQPTVGPDKKFIELALRPELVEFEGFVNYGSPILALARDRLGRPLDTAITENSILMPIFKTIRLPDQNLTVQDGATVVLGGLITNKTVKIEDKTPILGDIPIAGRLFRSEANRTIREAVIVTVNAELVDPTGVPWRNR